MAVRAGRPPYPHGCEGGEVRVGRWLRRVESEAGSEEPFGDVGEDCPPRITRRHVDEKRSDLLREATVHHSGQGKFAIRRGDWVLIFAPTGDDNGKKGEPSWFQKDRGYEPHTVGVELFNLATDPAQKYNLYATETAKVNELKTLMERYVREGRSTAGPKQKNDVEIAWDKLGK